MQEVLSLYLPHDNFKALSSGNSSVRMVAIIHYCYHNYSSGLIQTFLHQGVEVRFLLKTFFLGLC